MPIAFASVDARPLLGGDAGVEQTIQQMRMLVDHALRDPAIIRLATDIVRHVPAYDDHAEAKAIYEWVKRNIRFTKDPVNKEKLYPPAELLKIRAGDCDDISMLTGTLLMAVGYPARLMTVAASSESPSQFSHVYIEGEVPAGSGQWIPIDAARYDSEFGLAPAHVYRARWWSLTDGTHGDLSGLPFSPAMRGLGYYPRFRSHALSGLGTYGRVRTMGDDSTSSTIATIAQGSADIIRAAKGQQASPFDYSASGPWSSFQTQYSPNGARAGYSAAPLDAGFSASGNLPMWIGIGLFAMLAFGGRK